MKAIMKIEPGPGAEVKEVGIPEIKDNEVLVKVMATTICGTDVHIYMWDEWSSKRIKPPMIFGHEFSGEVVEVGKSVKSVKPGDFVSAETHIACGHCYMCRTGNAHLCINVKILGVDTDGAFAEYVAIPEANVWQNDRSIPPEIASMQEPFGNAVHATLIEDVAGKTVAIFGAGPIGIMSAEVARASGASKIFIVEPNEFRRNLASRFGKFYILNPQEVDPVEFIMDMTEGIGVDVFLEMSGAPKAIIQGIRSTRKGGRVSLLGIPKSNVEFEEFAEDIVFRGIRIYGINGRLMFDTWYRVRELLTSRRVDLAPLITHKFTFDDVDKAMDLLIKKQAAKIVLYPQKEE